MPKSKTDLEVKSTGDSASGQTNSNDQKTGEEPTANTQQDSNIIDATNEESTGEHGEPFQSQHFWRTLQTGPDSRSGSY